MANLIIKSSADDLVLKGSGGNSAITVGTDGATTFAQNATLSGTANNLGTVTAGNISNSAIAYPAGHVVGSKVICDENLSSNIYTDSSIYVDTGLEIPYVTKRTSADSYLIYEMYYGIGTVADADSLYFDVTMTAAQNTTYVSGESIATSTFPFYFDHTGTAQYGPLYLKLFCGLETQMGMPTNKGSWAVGDTLYFRLFFKNGGSGTSCGFYNNGTLWYSVTEVER